MKPENTKTVFLAGPEHVNRNMLLQCALNLAENGDRIVYISTTPMTELPAAFQDALPETETLRRIIFMYFSNYQEILQYCADIYKSPKPPKAIIIDEFDRYCKLSQPESLNIQQMALLCATILDAASYCATKANSVSYVIVACYFIENVEYYKRLKLLIDLYFYENVWFIQEKHLEADIKNVMTDILKVFE